MNMQRLFSWILFFLAFTITVIASQKVFYISLHAFVPYLFYLLYKSSASTALRQAFICGLIIDLLSMGHPVGFWAFIYSITFMFLMRLKQSFFFEKVFTLPILTAFFSFSSTLLYLLLLNIFGPKTSLSLKWILVDLMALPALDALYALIIFSLPLKILGRWFRSAPRRTKSLNIKNSAL